jgi:ankyrin repeat protein
VRADDVELAQAMLKAGADPKQPNRYGVLPMTLAAANGNAAMIRVAG